MRWLLVNVEPVVDTQGQPDGTVACFTDVTEKRSQQTLMTHTIDTAGLGTWQWDMRGGGVPTWPTPMCRAAPSCGFAAPMASGRLCSPVAW